MNTYHVVPQSGQIAVCRKQDCDHTFHGTDQDELRTRYQAHVEKVWGHLTVPQRWTKTNRPPR